MTWLKAIGYFSLLVLFGGLGLLASMTNSDLVQVNMHIWKSPEAPLGLVLAITLAAGCMLGVLVNSVVLWQFKRQRNKLRKQLDNALQRFEKLQ